MGRLVFASALSALVWRRAACYMLFRADCCPKLVAKLRLCHLLLTPCLLWTVLMQWQDYTPLALVALAGASPWLAAWLALHVLPNMFDSWFIFRRILACAAGNITFLPILDACMCHALSLCVACFSLTFLPPSWGA